MSRLNISAEWQKFYNDGIHFQFEEADKTNDVAAMDALIQHGYGDFMQFHFMATYPTFQWENYLKHIGATPPSEEEHYAFYGKYLKQTLNKFQG